jgi:hypothetical protein
MSKSPTVAQLLVLATAAQRSNHMVMPLPSTVRVRGGAQRNLLAALLRMELVEEIQVDDPAFAWRTDDAGRHLGLRLTATGLAAAGVPEGVSSPPADRDSREEQAPASSGVEPTSAGAPAGGPPARRPTGKLGDVLQAISAGAGATLSEITALTGWLPHTARAAVTGLRQRRFPVQLIEREGRKAYRLTTTG